MSAPPHVAHPSHDDPLVRAASEGIGGPVGDRAAAHPWWSPLRVVLAVACLALALGMVQKSPCVAQRWAGGNTRYAAMCYSDVPYLYTGRGFAERLLPYAPNGGRYPAMEYPVVIGYFAYGSALLTQATMGWPDVENRARYTPDGIYGAPGVAAESWRYFEVTAVLLAPFGLLTAWFLARASRGRPWDAMAYAASPMLVLAGLINWDLLAVCAVAGALWAWSRGRPLLAGVLIGVGTATKLYPLFLLGALFVVAVRRARLRAFAGAAVAAGVAWLLVNLPAMMWGFEEWKAFWTFNSKRPADLGSLWLVWQQAGHTIGVDTINTVSWLWFGSCCLLVLSLGLLAPRPPRVAQLAYLVVAAFLVVNKVYSPQYVLWLLPLAVLARPRWRDLLVWQAGEALYFAGVWLYLGGYTASASSGQPDHTYWLVTILRVAAEVYLAVMVVRDVLHPELDPVRADGRVDDPLEPAPSVERVETTRSA